MLWFFHVIFWHKKFILIFMVFGLISANNVEKPTAINDVFNTTFIEKSNSKCGNTQKMVDDCFKDFPPYLMEFLQTTKIALDTEEIKSKCTVFKRGMECFDEYTQSCLTKKKIDILRNNVEGARNFFKKFCNDSNFQSDYLRHKDCFHHIQDDWIKCTQTFRGIVSDELHEEHTNVTNKFMEFCCARYAFENCIYNSARYKCYSNAVDFARETARMLSDEKHFSNCRQYENAVCVSNNGRRLRFDGVWYLFGFFSLLMMLRYQEH